MNIASSSREILKDLLQGSAASRPLFVPIVFALGARVENLSLRAFLGSPTKISNSVRQTRSRLQADGVSCYFDPLLEAEALGGTLDWLSEQGPAVLRSHESSEIGQPPVGLHLPDEILKSGRIPVALEVIGRLKALLRQESLLMAGLSGPLTLAAQLTGLHARDRRDTPDVSNSALEVATSTVTQVSKAFAEAGANLLFFREDIVPLEQPDVLENWISLLTPIFNIIRFYEALPVLQISDEVVFRANGTAVLQGIQGCVMCASPRALAHLLAKRRGISQSATLGISLPASVFLEEQGDANDASSILTRLISDLRPALVTTAEDLPPTADFKRLAAFSALIRR